MNKTAKTITLSFVLLLAADLLFGQSYVRPVSLPAGTDSKIIRIVEYQDGTRYAVDRDDNDKFTPGGQVKDTLCFLLINGMLMETTKKGEGNMKLGEEILPLDGVKLGGVSVSDPKKRMDLTGHDPLDISVEFRRTEYKYKDTLRLSPALMDSVLRVETRMLMHCGEENVPDFKIIFNDTVILPPDGFKAGPDIDVNLSEQLGKLGLADMDGVKKVTVVPEDHIPTVISNVKYNIIEDRSELPPVDPKIPWWCWLIVGLIVVMGIAAVLWLRWRRKKADKKAEEEEKEEKIMPIATPRTEEQKKWEEELSRLRNQKNRLEEELKKEKENLEKACEKIRKQSEEEINRLKDQNNRLKEDLKTERDDADKRVAAARDEERAKFESTINTLSEEKKSLSDTLEKERELAREQIAEAHEEERKIAEKTITDLKDAHQAEVDRLEAEQRIYSEKIAFVPFASQYAKDIYSLISTVNDINRQARELSRADVEDPYLIFKAISKFNLAQSEIDYEGMLLDVSLAAKDDMSFADSGITNLKTVSQDQMFSSLRSYFLSAYLEKYINAAVVYNESLAGIDRLVEGIDESMTAPFKLFREKLKECCKRLGIAVISVKLFDTLGDNVDLKATMVDYDSSLPADSIIAIENCLVYPEGGRRPMEKIYVKAQK